MNFFEALGMELFISIHYSVFVLYPLAKMRHPDDAKNYFKAYFVIRAVILVIGNIITPAMAFLDFIGFFIVCFGYCVPLMMKGKLSMSTKTTTEGTTRVLTLQDKVCPKCNSLCLKEDIFCANCGERVGETNVLKENPLKLSDFNSVYLYPENIFLEKIMEQEMAKASIDYKLIPTELLRRKSVFRMIFIFLLFMSVVSIFFHFPFKTYIIEVVLLFILFCFSNRYNLKKYLIKEIKARPQERISNVIMMTKTSMVKDNTKMMSIIGVIGAIAIPLIMFVNPIIFYEKVDNGYGVRFYLWGLTNFTTAEIPDEHNGEPVTTLRGNTFSNMYFLKEVKLPETLLEIRGETFLNDYSLVTVNIPSKITEIKGSTFENCYSLEKITIPDEVERIGGSAFRECHSLSTVEISENSKLKTIGSSSFRGCNSLTSIWLPKGVSLNERSFKESPTRINYYGSNDGGYDNEYGYYYDYNY